MKTAVLTSMLLISSLTAAKPASGDAMIQVHLIDARKGVPIPRKPIRIWIFGRPGYQEGKTDGDGVTVFQLGNPLPREITVHTGMGGYWEECLPNDRAGFSVTDILTTGVSREGVCPPPGLPKIDSNFVPKPGELYLFVSHLSILERFKYCGHWGCRGK